MRRIRSCTGDISEKGEYGQEKNRKMGKLRELINRHEKLKFLDLCIRNVNNESFRAGVLGRDSQSLLLTIDPAHEKTGILYHIRIGSRGDGFFAEYRRLLNYLYYADQLHLIPYIEFTQDYTYAEKHPVHGHTNPFEYYFLQPCVTEEESREYRYTLTSRDCDQDFSRHLKPENGYDLSEEYVSAIADVSRKYIRPNKETEEMMQEASAFLGERKTLGVHVRLTDFKKNYYGHPTCVTADRHLEAARSAVEKYGFEQIFLATDDVETVELFRKEFGEKLLTYQDVIRSEGEVSVAFSHSERENHHYLLGLEVLRDMYTLSLCSGLVAGKSQVSICAYIQRRVTGDYECREIIDAGYNTDPAHRFSDHVEELCG